MLDSHCCVGLYEKVLPADVSWSDRLKIARNLGFDFVEISIDEDEARIACLYFSKQQKHVLSNLIRDSGIAIRSMCLSAHRKYPFGSSDPRIQEKARELMKYAIEFSTDPAYGSLAVIIQTFETRGIDVSVLPGVIVSKHGPFTWREGAAKAVEHAVILQQVTKMALFTEMVSPDTDVASQKLQNKHFLESMDPIAAVARPQNDEYGAITGGAGE